MSLAYVVLLTLGLGFTQGYSFNKDVDHRTNLSCVISTMHDNDPKVCVSLSSMAYRVLNEN